MYMYLYVRMYECMYVYIHSKLYGCSTVQCSASQAQV